MDRVHSLTQAYSQAPWRKQMQLIGLFSLALVLIALVAGLYLNLTARAASIGRDIQSMQSDIDEYQQGNLNLQSQLASLTSSMVMEKRALAMGFKPIGDEKPLYITVPGYQGRQPVVLAPAPGRVLASAPAAPPEYTESIFEWLHRESLQPGFPLSYVPFLGGNP